MNGKKLIIWDWNGTLLNDVSACVKAMNIMLDARNIQNIDELFYKNIFTFPVQDYYKALGFDFEKEPFEELSIEYISLYKKLSENAPLQEGALDAIKYLHKNKYTQVILSASEQNALEQQVKDRNIFTYFGHIIGLNNIHAKSKLHNALSFFENTNFNTSESVLIGDTYHDYEVARAIGCDCVLVKNGHQNLSQFNFDINIKFLNILTEIIN